jgi:transposase
MNEVYIGIDAHKETNKLAYAADGREPAKQIGTVSADLNRTLESLRKFQKKHTLTKEQLHICYEAGPTGFVLARRLIKLGYDCVVVAPSKTPKKSGDKVRTDRRDARKLAHYLRSGDLTAIHIPDVDDEVIRDVCRGRTDAVQEVKRSKQQLLSFLLRNGYRYSGSAHWSEPHMRYLRELVLAHPAQKHILEEYLQRIDEALKQVGRIEDQMDQRLATWARRPFAEALMGFRGFKTTASMVLTSEIGDFTRFDHPKKLMAFLGVIPGEDSTGSTRRQGPITRCGNTHARWMLIESAGSYRLPPKVSKGLSKRQEGLSKEVCKLSWHAQNRLNKRWFKLSMRGLHFNKIRVAVARELSSYLWDLAHIVN